MMDSLVVSNMMHRPARTLVSVLGIGVGILLIVFTIGLSNGSLRERARRESNVGAEIMFRAAGSMGLTGADVLRLPASLGADLEKVDGVAAVVPIGQNSVVANETTVGNRLIDGVPFDKYAEIAGLQVVAGRKFVDGSDEMMTDPSWLERRNKKIGDKFPIYERDFEIVGTYAPSAERGSRYRLRRCRHSLGLTISSRRS